MRFSWTAAWAIQISVSASAAEIHVFAGQSIQAAIDAAVFIDHVVVHPGTYAEAIDFKGKAIVVRSTDGPSTAASRSA